MESILTRLARGECLLCDGAMGTELHALGLSAGECPELWCVEYPSRVRAIHARYREAGSDIVECNSFGASRYKLRHYGLEDRVREINRAAAEVARSVAGDSRFVMGSIGPTGAFLEPYGDETPAAFEAAFGEQAEALEQGGADMVIVETMTAIEECVSAIKAVRQRTDLVTVASFTFDPRPDGDYVSMMGVKPETFALAAVDAGAQVIGTNCGTGAEDMIRIVARLRAATPSSVPILAMPNAGMPELEDGRTVFREEPESLAARVSELLKAGARIIGGCCGTTPAHIAAMRRVLDA